MNTNVALILGVALLVCLACAAKPGTQSSNSAQPSPSPVDLAEFKALLFADQTLEELSKVSAPTESDPRDPFRLFNSSLAASRQGNKEQAKKDLQQALVVPGAESRVQLWAWKALRELGEGPGSDIADRVQGIVCELHNEAGVGTVAAYGDGGARWLGGQGKVIVWDASGSDPEIQRLIKALLKAGEPLIKTAPLSNMHKTPDPEPEHFRVSILTFAGIRTIEVYGPDMTENHPVAPVLVASVNLLDALMQKDKASAP